MSILDIAAVTPAKKSSGPVQFVEVRPAIHDEGSGRSYQLAARESDRVPHTLSADGSHTGAAMLDALNESKRLGHERSGLAPASPDKRTAAEVKADSARLAEIKKELAALLSVEVQRTDRTARMLQVYAARGIS